MENIFPTGSWTDNLMMRTKFPFIDHLGPDGVQMSLFDGFSEWGKTMEVAEQAIQMPHAIMSTVDALLHDFTHAVWKDKLEVAYAEIVYLGKNDFSLTQMWGWYAIAKSHAGHPNV